VTAVGHVLRPFLQLLACLLATAVSLPAGADFTASGTFLFEDRPFDRNGFTGEQGLLPIRRADVEVVDLLTQAVLGTGRTDEDGAFQVEVALTAARTVYVRCLTATADHPLLNVQVMNHTGEQSLYSLAGPPAPNHDPWSDLQCGTLTAAAGGAGEAFNILDAAVKALDYYYALSGEYPGPAWSLALFWMNGAGENSCWYDDVYRQVILADNAGYDDSVILHETGHYMQSAFALCQNPGGMHYVTDMNQDCRLAFSEGWATFYASAVRLYHQEPEPQLYVRTTGGSGAGNLDFAFELEGPSFPVFGSFNELAVGACLWDLVDRSQMEAEPYQLDDDQISGKDQRIWYVLSEILPGTGEATMEAFWDGWSALGQEQPAGVQAIFSGLGMEYADDTWEPADNKISGATALEVVNPPLQPRVVINEMGLGALDWLELYNGGGDAVNLAGWTVRAGRDGGAATEFELPSFTLYPHHFLALFEGGGEDGVDRIFLPGTNIPWVTSGAGFCVLRDDSGTGIDFCRWGDSTEAPPPGTNWTGINPDLPYEGMNLGRDSAGSDTDQGDDFGSRAPTAGGPNWEPGGGLNHHSFYPAGDRDWLRVQAQAGQRCDLEVFNRCSGAAAGMTLYAADGITALFSEDCSGAFGSGPRRAWMAPADGEYLLKLVNDGQLGDYGSYDLQATVIPLSAPSPAALEPAVLGTGVCCPVTLTGDGFIPGLSARFSSDEITCERVEVVDRSTVVVLVRSSAAAAPGSHDLLLRGPDGAEGLLPGALQVEAARGSVVINELNTLENWIELRNTGGIDVDLAGWEIRVGAGGSAVAASIPPATIGPGNFLLLYDLGTAGENGPAELHLDRFFGWGVGIYGSCALVDTGGAGRDFVRWDGATGSSLNQPPQGTGWYGPNPASVSGYFSLGRDQGSTDSDTGGDFSAQESSPATANWAPAPLDPQLMPLEPSWVEDELSRQLEAAGGEPPYRWFLSRGSLPPGVTFSEAGLLQGAAMSLGSWPLEVSVHDAAERWASGELLLEILPLLSSSLEVQPGLAVFPCTVDLDVDFANLRSGEAVVAARLTATGMEPEGISTYELADSTLVLPAGQTRHLSLTLDLPDNEQFTTGVTFQLTLHDAASGILLTSAQCQVRNHHQLQHQQHPHH
jgi:hypothetical protein